MPPLRIDIITLFPEPVKAYLGESMMRRAEGLDAVIFNTVNPRDFSDDPHRCVDDRPYGGGPGMIMKPEPLAAAIESVKTPQSRVIYLSPQGKPFVQAHAESLAAEESHLILVCGHYEGIDERICELLIDEEISIGDYVLTSGVLPACVLTDAVVRLLPGVLGGEGAAEAESFSSGILDHPHYTRPESFRDQEIPEILRSGNHAAIAAWRAEQAQQRTADRRPDLLK